MNRVAKMVLALLAVLAVAAAGVTTKAQGDARPVGMKPMKMVRLTGWIVDDAGAKKHANAESKDAVLASHEDGSPLIFWTEDDRFYKIDNEEQALERVGQRWIVMGTLNAEEILKIGTFLDPETGEASRAEARKELRVRTKQPPSGE